MTLAHDPAGRAGSDCLVDLVHSIARVCDGQRTCCINQARLSQDPCPMRDKTLTVAWQCGRTPQGATPHDQDNDSQWHQQMGTMDSLDDSPASPSVLMPPAVVSPCSSSSSSLSRRCDLSISLSGHPVSNGAGLFNQLFGMMSLFAIATLSRCNLSVDGFLPDFDSIQTVPFGMVMDLAITNHNLRKRDKQSEDEQKNTPTQAPTTNTTAAPAAAAALFVPHLSLLDSSFDSVGSAMWLPPASPPLDRCPSVIALLDVDSASFDSFATQLAAHPYPGTLWMGQAWGTWALSVPAHMDAHRDVIFSAMTFAPPFVQAAAAMQRALQLSPGEYTTVHFRFEDDVTLFAKMIGISLTQFLETTFERLVREFDARLEEPTYRSTYNATAATAASTGAPPPSPLRPPPSVYLATGVRSAHPYVVRFRALYPQLHVYTKDQLLASYCQVASSLSPTPLAPPLVDAFLAALDALPWTSGVDKERAACAWLRGDKPNPLNREYWAILDFLLATQSRTYIGYGGSTLSSAVGRHIHARHAKLQVQQTDGTITTVEQISGTY